VDSCSAFIVVTHTQGALEWITQFYLQITPYLPLPRSVQQTAPPLTAVADIATYYEQVVPSGEHLRGGGKWCICR